MALQRLRDVGTFAKRVLALEPTIREMRESVARYPPGIFRPVSTPWYATEVVFREHRDDPVEINRDVGQLLTSLGDGDDWVTSSSVEGCEGMSVPTGRDLYFQRGGAANLEEGVVSFSRELQRNDVGDRRRMF